jgi:hypothetical protein
MTDRLTTALIISGIAVLCLLLWALSIAFVLRDVNRRRLPGYEQAAWIALAALLPLIGGAAYLFARVLDRIFSPRASKAIEAESRLTAYKPPDKAAERLPTIAAADLLHQPVTRLDQAESAGQALMPPQKERLPSMQAGKAGQARGRRDSLFLEVIAGPLAGRRFNIETLPARIGRGPLVALSLDDDQGISRYHAEIYESAGLLRIRDMQSTHGTYLNGKNITDERLNPGDHLSVGQSTLVFMAEDQDGIS